MKAAAAAQVISAARAAMWIRVSKLTRRRLKDDSWFKGRLSRGPGFQVPTGWR